MSVHHHTPICKQSLKNSPRISTLLLFPNMITHA